MEKLNNNKLIIASIILGFALLVASYLIAQSNRYVPLGPNNEFILDKWSKKVYTIRGDYKWELEKAKSK